MNTPLREETPVDQVLRELGERNKLDETTVLLIGSVAREMQTPRSDVDVLVIAPTHLVRLSDSSETQVFLTTRARFLERLMEGDDFPHWVVRFGKVLSDKPQWWQEVLHNPAIHRWPDWKRKRDQAGKRLSFASRLYESEDYDHAQEEYLLSVGHLARALLLKRRTFPLSRPELPGQLRELGYTDLSNALDSLVSDSLDPTTLTDIDRLLNEYLLKLAGQKSAMGDGRGPQASR